MVTERAGVGIKIRSVSDGSARGQP